jgi:hypothetical protein
MTRGLRQALGWKPLLTFVGFVIALSAWSWSGALLTTKPVPLSELAEYFVSIALRTSAMYFTIYVAVAIADGLPLRGRRRTLALVAALLAGSALAVQTRCLVMPDQLLYLYGSTQVPYCDSFPTPRTYFDFPASWLTPLTTAGLIMIFVFGRRRDQQLQAALRAASSAQIESRRQRIESEIEAMRSRVDPDVLLDSLRDIRARYERDAADGEAGLEALIGRLREAAGRAPQPAGSD